jgi:hypothetical protein
MDKETLREIFLSLSSKDVRIAKYSAKKHICSAQGSLQWCTNCNLQLCSMCYVKHIRDSHNQAIHFLEKIAESNLLGAAHLKESIRDTSHKRRIEASHASKRKTKSTPTNPLDFLNGEELTKLLEKVREHQIAQ